MKAGVWHGRKDVRIEGVPDPPPPPPGQIQVEVAWCGICGTDLHEYLGGPLHIPFHQPHPLTGVSAPVILGHEMCGRVVDIGDGVENFSVGDRIAACPIIGCGKCRWCQSGSMGQCDKVAFLGLSWSGGALAERVNLFTYQCFHLPDKITDEAGALVEPFSATVRAVERGHCGPDDKLAIIGAGPIGLMALMAARISGVKNITVVEIAERRIKAAELCGAAAVINPNREDPEKRALEMTDGRGFDVVMECAGLQKTALMAARMTRTRGRVVVLGVFEAPAPVDLTDLVFREKDITGSLGGYGVYPETISMMTDPRFRSDVLITDRIGLDALVEEGYNGLLHETSKHVKIVVQPTC